MMKNSKNETVMVKLEDTDGSKLCNYKKCDFKCNPNLPENINETKLDIDTFDIEPLPKDHPLLSTPNTLITPHIGYVTNEAYEAYYDGIIENVITFLNNNPLRVLNPDVLNKIYTK